MSWKIALFAALWMLPAAPLASGAVRIARLPGLTTRAVKVDGSGRIYLAGQLTAAGGVTSAFITKLSADGSTTYYAITLGGSGVSTAVSLDVDSSGAAYVTGTTTASDFAITPSSAQVPGATAFVAKLDAQGNIVYVVPIGGA